jgi:hypothetical protein
VLRHFGVNCCLSLNVRWMYNRPFYKNSMLATCVEFEMRRLPLRGEKKVQIPPGHNSNLTLSVSIPLCLVNVLVYKFTVNTTLQGLQ